MLKGSIPQICTRSVFTRMILGKCRNLEDADFGSVVFFIRHKQKKPRQLIELPGLFLFMSKSMSFSPAQQCCIGENPRDLMHQTYILTCTNPAVPLTDFEIGRKDLRNPGYGTCHPSFEQKRYAHNLRDRTLQHPQASLG